jgi:hypothetical protein
MSEGAQWLRLFKGFLSQYKYIEKQEQEAFESRIDSNSEASPYSPYAARLADFKHDLKDSIELYKQYRDEHSKDKQIKKVDTIINEIVGYPRSNLYKNFTRERVGPVKRNNPTIYNALEGGSSKQRKTRRRQRK